MSGELEFEFYTYTGKYLSTRYFWLVVTYVLVGRFLLELLDFILGFDFFLGVAF